MLSSSSLFIPQDTSRLFCFLLFFPSFRVVNILIIFAPQVPTRRFLVGTYYTFTSPISLFPGGRSADDFPVEMGVRLYRGPCV